MTKHAEGVSRTKLSTALANLLETSFRINPPLSVWWFALSDLRRWVGGDSSTRLKPLDEIALPLPSEGIQRMEKWFQRFTPKVVAVGTVGLAVEISDLRGEPAAVNVAPVLRMLVAGPKAPTRRSPRQYGMEWWYYGDVGRLEDGVKKLLEYNHQARIKISADIPSREIEEKLHVLNDWLGKNRVARAFAYCPRASVEGYRANLRDGSLIDDLLQKLAANG